MLDLLTYRQSPLQPHGRSDMTDDRHPELPGHRYRGVVDRPGDEEGQLDEVVALGMELTHGLDGLLGGAHLAPVEHIPESLAG